MNPCSTSVRSQLHANPVPHVDALGTLHQPAFDGRIEKADPRALGGGARDDGVEPLPDSRLQQQRRRRLPHLPFHLLGGILLFRAVLRQRLQVVVAVGGGLTGQRGLQQPLGNDVRIAAVGGRGMGIVPDRQPEVPRRARRLPDSPPRTRPVPSA